MDPIDYSEQKITVEVPHKEVLGYATDLKSMTQGRGRFEFEFIRYDYAPDEVAAKIIAEAKAAE